MYSITSETFINNAKCLVLRDNIESSDSVMHENVFMVWYCKQLQNHKALFGTTKNNYYYEITYDGDRGRFYFDKYDKLENKEFTVNLTEVAKVKGV